MDDYTPMYCASCAQLRFTERLNAVCEFCGSTIFASVRPKPTYSEIDKRELKKARIAEQRKAP